MNYKIVLDLCLDSEFVYRIQTWYELRNEINAWDRAVSSRYKDETISVWNWDKFRFEKAIITLKEINYARDLIVHYNLDINFELSNKNNTIL